MYVYIVPRRLSSDLPKGTVAINLVARNRMDILLLFLRIVRYLFQNGVAGEGLVWSNEEDKTGIFIEVMSAELLSSTNMRPAIFIDVGEVIYRKTALMENKSSMGMNGSMRKFSEHNLQVSMTIIGRNKIEAEKIGERLAQTLFLLNDVIKENTKNIEDIDPIRLSKVSPLPQGNSPAGDSTKAFSSAVTFGVKYYLEFGLLQQGDLFTSLNFKVTSTNKDGGDDNFVVESTQVYKKVIKK